jgi:hypothetical protein
MKDILFLLGVIVVWFGLSRWVLPWFGIPTCCMSGNCRTACSSALNDDAPQPCDKDVCRPTEDPK